MSRPAGPASSMVELTIDEQTVTVPVGTTIFDAARMNGIEIPVLCHQQNETPVGVCRVCVVDVGGRAYQAACIRPAEAGIVVRTKTKEVEAARKTLIELMMADHPTPCVREQHSGDCELEKLAREYEAKESRYPRRQVARGQDNSSLTILVDHAACILCDRCVRACSDLRQNFVIARQGKGYDAGIAFDMDDPMGGSTCVSCGECMVSCPTGALTNKGVAGHKLESGMS
jgi:predicted molibdopterin-dependent oxidoreductase YjgC